MNESLPWTDIPLWLSHEYAHVIRYAEGESEFGRFIIEGSLDYKVAIDNVPFIEFLVDEGLATAAAQKFGGPVNTDHDPATASPAPANAARALGFNDEEFARCRAHEDDLWQEIRPKLHCPLTLDGYSRYFSYGAEDIVPRSGYFLGFTVVERFLNMSGVELATAVRMPAAEYAIAVP